MTLPSISLSLISCWWNSVEMWRLLSHMRCCTLTEPPPAAAPRPAGGLHRWLNPNGEGAGVRPCTQSAFLCIIRAMHCGNTKPPHPPVCKVSNAPMLSWYGAAGSIVGFLVTLEYQKKGIKYQGLFFVGTKQIKWLETAVLADSEIKGCCLLWELPAPLLCLNSEPGKRVVKTQ